MSKRVFCLLCMILLLMAVSVVAYADSIYSNDFHHHHREDMLELERSRFVVNAPDGYVTLKDEPGAKEDVSIPRYGGALTYENGTEILLNDLYIHNGEYWGVMPSSHYVLYPGWIPMDQLLAVYVRSDFNKEHQNEFYTYSGNYNVDLSEKRLVLWQWPGSDREKRVLDVDELNLGSNAFIHIYKDKDGREWGYIWFIKYYAHEWICLSDPGNSKIPSFHPAPEPMKWSPDGIYKWAHIDTPDIEVQSVEQYSLSHISKVRVFDASFEDVPDDAWYSDAIATVYEYDAFDGKRNNKFAPDGNLTRAEALEIAAKIHAHYKYGREEGSSLIDMYDRSNNFYGHAGMHYWWLGTVEYCRSEGIIGKTAPDAMAEGYDETFDYYGNDDYYDDRFDHDYYYLAPIGRAEAVHIWASILEEKDMAKQNTVVSLPDVNHDTNYSADIFFSYEVGIVNGVDSKGTFNPDRHITRAEASTIFTNLIDVSKRHSGRVYG